MNSSWELKRRFSKAEVSLLILSGGFLSQTQAAEAGSVPTEPLSFGTALQVIGGLLAVLLVFAGLAFLLRRLTGMRASGSGRIRIVDGLMLSARDRLVLVRVGETELLLGLTPGRIQALHVFEGREGNSGAPFTAAFDQEMTRLDQEEAQSC